MTFKVQKFNKQDKLPSNFYRLSFSSMGIGCAHALNLSRQKIKPLIQPFALLYGRIMHAIMQNIALYYNNSKLNEEISQLQERLIQTQDNTARLKLESDLKELTILLNFSSSQRGVERYMQEQFITSQAYELASEEASKADEPLSSEEFLALKLQKENWMRDKFIPVAMQKVDEINDKKIKVGDIAEHFNMSEVLANKILNFKKLIDKFDEGYALTLAFRKFWSKMLDAGFKLLKIEENINVKIEDGELIIFVDMVLQHAVTKQIVLCEIKTASVKIAKIEDIYENYITQKQSKLYQYAYLQKYGELPYMMYIILAKDAASNKIRRLKNNAALYANQGKVYEHCVSEFDMQLFKAVDKTGQTKEHLIVKPESLIHYRIKPQPDPQELEQEIENYLKFKLAFIKLAQQHDFPKTQDFKCKDCQHNEICLKGNYSLYYKPKVKDGGTIKSSMDLPMIDLSEFKNFDLND